MLKQQLARLSKQEQQRLSLALIIILCLSAWLFIWKPVNAKNEQLTSTLEQKVQLLNWMQASALKVKSNATTQKQFTTASLQQHLSRQAQRFKLKLSRIQTTSSGKVQLQMEQADFNNLLALINQLDSEGVTLEQLAINRKNNRGNVSARLTFGVSP
ncbi:MAG: type II secretion system protein GspM [Pontibacterium sp.]